LGRYNCLAQKNSAEGRRREAEKISFLQRNFRHDKHAFFFTLGENDVSFKKDKNIPLNFEMTKKQLFWKNNQQNWQLTNILRN
jgi:hypothetical protein